MFSHHISSLSYRAYYPYSSQSYTWIYVFVDFALPRCVLYTPLPGYPLFTTQSPHMMWDFTYVRQCVRRTDERVCSYMISECMYMEIVRDETKHICSRRHIRGDVLCRRRRITFYTEADQRRGGERCNGYDDLYVLMLSRAC